MTGRTLALLIDGDNAEASLLPQILDVVSQHGDPIIRRIYGDWTESEMKGWKEVLHTYSIDPMQQFRYTTGKNATDSYLIIDAIDILYKSDVTGFCIVSSDSDYTRLATRIRENNLFVLGIGRRTTPNAFINACSNFIFTEDLPTISSALANGNHRPRPTLSQQDKKLLRLLWQAWQKAADETGWADLSAIGSVVRELDATFQTTEYGHHNLSRLVRDYPHYIEFQNASTNKHPRYRIRMKR